MCRTNQPHLRTSTEFRMPILEDINTVLVNTSVAIENGLHNVVGESVYKVLNLNKFLIGRIIVVILYYIIGVTYYSNAEGWSTVDCVFFVTVSVSTVGYGDFVPTTDHARVFTAFFILFGLLFVLTTVDGVARHVAGTVQVALLQRFIETENLAVRIVSVIFN